MPLQERLFQPLPLGQVLPAGWLLAQLRLQADGLTGHLDEFWPDVARSRWIGGDAEGWERGPYWLDGAVPLAFLLGDAPLQAKVGRWVDEILTQQGDDGWLGPVLDAQYSYPYDSWPRFVVLKALVQYYEATGDERIPQAIERFLRKVAELLPERPLRSWARMRWADLVLTIHWLYDRTGAAWLLDLAALLRAQGFDWRWHFEHFPFYDKIRREESDLTSHGVNNAMGIKAPGIWYRQSGDPADRDAVLQIIAALDRFHGQANGLYSCDEHLAGRSPSQGSELCTVTEYMFSLETVLPVLGLPELADRLEALAYNALPATLSPDMWSHQYDQQVNQVQCMVVQERVYTTNGPDSNIFGLEPHFGCCTANMHQGWPKFAAHLWMRSRDGGLAAIAYAPCVVRAEAGGTPVVVETSTTYPFGDEIRISVRAERPAVFPLHLRVPGWAEGATLEHAGQAQAAQPGTFLRIEREWVGEQTLVLRLPMRLRAERRFNNSVSLFYGPLLLGLKVGEYWQQMKGELPHADWQITPTTPWNYALELDLAALDTLQVAARPVAAQPFAPDAAPLSFSVQGRRVPSWGLERGAAAPPPPSPVSSDEPLEDLTLIPYACTNLRVAELPVLAGKGDR